MGVRIIFRWLFQQFRQNNDNVSNIGAFRKAIAIDVSGPEFHDLYPTLPAFKKAVAASGAFKPNAVDWIAKAIFRKIRDGTSYRGALEAVTRAGDFLSPEQLRAIGTNPRRKLGNSFVASLADDKVSDAIAKLEDAIIATTSTANQLHNLRRNKEAGISHCVFSSARDERCTDLERELEGKRLTIEEAMDLVKARGAEIKRSVFQGEVNF